jgi:hypothetical protein
MKIQDLIVLENGASINGDVLVKTFVLVLPYGKLKLEKSDILSIEYRNPSHATEDQVQVSAGTRLGGDLEPDIIPIRFESTTQILKIPKTDIHSIVLFLEGGKVSAKTLRSLKALKAAV